MPDLIVDPARYKQAEGLESTGIFIRAKLDGHWGSYNIAVLERDSLLDWLRSTPEMAERTVLVLLGYPRG